MEWLPLLASLGLNTDQLALLSSIVLLSVCWPLLQGLEKQIQQRELLDRMLQDLGNP